jgi:hypothetical protein
MVKKNNKILYICIISISIIVIGIVIWGFLTDWKFWNHKQEKKPDPPPKLPEYKLNVPIQKNTSQIEMDNPEKKGFKIGQQIQFGTGNKSETKTIVGFGSLILDSPTKFDHPKGTVIRVIKQAPEVPICEPGFFINIDKNNCEPCPNPPKNATHTKKNSCDWECNKNYIRSDSLGVPDSSGSQCNLKLTTCDKGFTLDKINNKCKSCSNPPGNAAHTKKNSCDWACNSGFVRSGSDGRPNDSGSQCNLKLTTCDKGFTLDKNKCESCPNPPANAAHTKNNSCDWACNSGFVRSGSDGRPNDSGSQCNLKLTTCDKGSILDAPNNYCEPCPNAPPARANYSKNNSCDWACTAYGTKRDGDRCVCDPALLPANATYAYEPNNCGFTCNYGYKKVYGLAEGAETTCVETSDTKDELTYGGNKCDTYSADGIFSLDLGQRLTQCKDWIKDNRTKEGETSVLCAHNGVLKSLAAYKTETGSDCPAFNRPTQTGKVILQPLEFDRLMGRKIVLWTDQNTCYPCVSDVHQGLPETYDKYQLNSTTDAALIIKDPDFFGTSGISHKDYLDSL